MRLIRKGKEFPAWIFELLTTTTKPVPLEQLRRFLSGGLEILISFACLGVRYSL